MNKETLNKAVFLHEKLSQLKKKKSDLTLSKSVGGMIQGNVFYSPREKMELIVSLLAKDERLLVSFEKSFLKAVEDYQSEIDREIEEIEKEVAAL